MIPIRDWSYLYFVGAVDADADGHEDVIVGAIGEVVKLFMGDGTGALHEALPLPASFWWTPPLQTADIDGDCLPDLLMGPLRHSGPGSLIDGDEVLTLPAGGRIIRAADITGDGREDIVALASESGEAKQFHIALADDATQLGTPFVVSAGLATPGDFAVGDVNGDGLDDLVPLSKTEGVRVLVSTGGGAFDSAPVYALPTTSKKRHVLADVDADGLDDLLVTIPGSLVRALSQGNGSFGPAQLTTIDPQVEAPEIVAGDLNGDGAPDAIAVDNKPGLSSDEGDVWRLLNNGTGSFGAATLFTTNAIVSDPALGDFDDDGDVDVALLEYNQILVVVENDGLGNLGPVTEIESNPLYWDGFQSLTARDLDADGVPDLVWVNNYGSDEFRVARGAPSGPLPSLRFPAPWPNQLAVVDLQGDGRPDIITATDTEPDTFVFRNRLVAPGAWATVGCALTGASEPQLSGIGFLASGASGALSLEKAAPFAAGFLFVALDAVSAPFKGGVLKAFPPLVGLPVVADGRGKLMMPYALASFPGGIEVTVQAALADVGAPQGVALSNGMRATSP